MSDEVRLRERQDGDDEVLYRAQHELDSWEQRSPSRPRPVTRDEHLARLTSRAADADTVEFVIEAAGRPVGRCGLFGVDALAHHAEVGIALVHEAQGRGVGTAALRQLAEFGFERWNLHRIHLTSLASNRRALACYRAVGFVEEGRRREHAWVRGHWEDEVLMGLLRGEWRAAQA